VVVVVRWVLMLAVRLVLVVEEEHLLLFLLLEGKLLHRHLYRYLSKHQRKFLV
jgi:hypothetical protein